MNKKEKEAIKDLEEIANGALPPELGKKEAQILVDLIENLQTKVYKLEYYESANDALIQNIKELKEENNTQKKLLNDAFSRGWIHKNKIKEKIEELKGREYLLNTNASEIERINEFKREGAIEVLEQLLFERR